MINVLNGLILPNSMVVVNHMQTALCNILFSDWLNLTVQCCYSSLVDIFNLPYCGSKINDLIISIQCVWLKQQFSQSLVIGECFADLIEFSLSKVIHSTLLLCLPGGCYKMDDLIISIVSDIHLIQLKLLQNFLPFSSK